MDTRFFDIWNQLTCKNDCFSNLRMGVEELRRTVLSSKHLHENRTLTTRFSDEREANVSYCFLEPIEQGMAAV